MSCSKTTKSRINKAIEAVTNSKIAMQEKTTIIRVFQRFDDMRSILYSDGCVNCRNAEYTDELYDVITPSGLDIETKINFCPTCGRMIKKRY